MTKVEIKHSGFHHDMAAWCIEKSKGIVENIALTKSFLDHLAEDPKAMEEARDHLRSALHDATKLFAFSTGAEWDTKDPDCVWNGYTNGFEQLCVRYGQLGETTKERQQRQVREGLD